MPGMRVDLSMAPRSFKPLLIIAFLIGVGAWLVGWAWIRIHTSHQLSRSSAATEGRVLKSATRPLSKAGPSSTLLVEYAPPNQAPITRQFDVDSADSKRALETGTATVTYLPEKPQISRVTRFTTMPFEILVWLGGLMALSGIVCLWHFMRTPPRGAPSGRVA